MRMAGFLFLRLGFVVPMKHCIRRHRFRPISGTLNGSPGCFGAAGRPDNSHIGNAAATAMGWQDEFNIGELYRTAYGDAAILIGFGTDRDTVAAASDWDAPMQVKTVLPAPSLSLAKERP
jgi:hypothetical protein